MITPRNFAEEREQARLEAEHLTALLQAYGYEVGAIEWERSGRLAFVPVNSVKVGDLITLPRLRRARTPPGGRAIRPAGSRCTTPPSRPCWGNLLDATRTSRRRSRWNAKLVAHPPG